MRIGDDELDATQTPPGQLPKKLGLDRLGFGCTDLHAEYLASTVGVDADGDGDGDRDYASAAACLQIGGVDPQIGPFLFVSAIRCGSRKLGK